MINYTQNQLSREVALLLSAVANLVDLVIGDGSGTRALGLEQGGHYDQTRHPDEIENLEAFDIWHHAKHVEDYVQLQVWNKALPTDISCLGLALERVFSPTVLAGYDEERASHPEFQAAVPDAFEEGAGDVPLSYFHCGILRSLVDRAAARLKVDRNERLTLAEIALLTGVAEPTVMTAAHRGNFPTVDEDRRRLAEPNDVLPWMIKNGYRPTCGLDSKSFGGVAEGSREYDDYVVVPVAADGSRFGPECASGGRYVIGRKGSERAHDDFYEALGELMRMREPRWRRKNSEGNRGIVKAVGYDRVLRKHIDQQLSEGA